MDRKTLEEISAAILRTMFIEENYGLTILIEYEISKRFHDLNEMDMKRNIKDVKNFIRMMIGLE